MHIVEDTFGNMRIFSTEELALEFIEYENGDYCGYSPVDADIDKTVKRWEVLIDYLTDTVRLIDRVDDEEDRVWRLPIKDTIIATIVSANCRTDAKELALQRLAFIKDKSNPFPELLNGKIYNYITKEVIQ